MEDRPVFDLRVLLENPTINSLDDSENTAVTTSTFASDSHNNRLLRLEKDFFAILDDDRELRPLAVEMQRDSFSEGQKCMRFYNVICGPKTATKRVVMNKCLILYAMQSFFLTIMP